MEEKNKISKIEKQFKEKPPFRISKRELNANWSF